MAEEQPPGSAELLAMQALLYAGDALDRAEADAFEARLEADQRAREALCRAVELVHSCAGDGPVSPDPAYRERVRRRVVPSRSVLGVLLGRRQYSGHPAAWAGLGAVVAALVILVFFGGPLAPVPAAGEGSQVAACAARPAPSVASAEPVHAETAKALVQLPRSQHLRKTHSEDAQRKARAETLQRLVKNDAGRTRLLSTNRN